MGQLGRFRALLRFFCGVPDAPLVGGLSRRFDACGLGALEWRDALFEKIIGT
jgi:hypothetical protein